MNSEAIKDMGATGGDINTSLAKLYAISNNTLEQIAEQQIALFGLYAECVTGQLNLFKTAQNYWEFIASQNNFIDSVTEKAQGITRNMIDITDESKYKACAWLKKRSENVYY